MTKKLFILSLGGSLIAPERVDSVFLKKFRECIVRRVNRGDRFIIITGGGKVCRDYQESFSHAHRGATKDELDWLGIHTTRLNAHLVRLLFGKLAHPEIVVDPNKKMPFREKILVGGGWRPGRSTDDDAVRLASVYGSSVIVNLSNIDYVYTKDPRKFKDAEKIEYIGWKQYMEMFGGAWHPGMNAPFDPVASRFAQKHGQEVYIVNGKNLKNLEHIFDGKKFVGTVIK